MLQPHSGWCPLRFAYCSRSEHAGGNMAYSHAWSVTIKLCGSLVLLHYRSGELCKDVEYGPRVLPESVDCTVGQMPPMSGRARRQYVGEFVRAMSGPTVASTWGGIATLHEEVAGRQAAEQARSPQACA